MRKDKKHPAKGKKNTLTAAHKKYAVIIKRPSIAAEVGIRPFTTGIVYATPNSSPYHDGSSFFIDFGPLGTGHQGYAPKRKHLQDIPAECLQKLRIKHTISHWQRGSQRSKAKRTKEAVPLFEWYQTKEEAMDPRVEIDEDYYDNMLGAVPPIYLNNTKTDAGYTSKSKTDTYHVFRQRMFAISEADSHTATTLVFTVCYEEVYERIEKGKGWIEVKPPAYFKQRLRLYTPELKGIWHNDNHMDKRGYIGKPYYKHKK